MDGMSNTKKYLRDQVQYPPGTLHTERLQRIHTGTKKHKSLSEITNKRQSPANETDLIHEFSGASLSANSLEKVDNPNLSAFFPELCCDKGLGAQLELTKEYGKHLIEIIRWFESREYIEYAIKSNN